MTELDDPFDLTYQLPFRLLEDEDEEDIVIPSTGDVLRNTFLIYGSIFLVVFLIFLCVRSRYPRTYNVRNNVPELNCALAEDTFGTLRWIYKVFFVPEEDMYHQCGLDSVVFLRILRFGTRISFMGMLNSIYLMPLYATSPTPDGEETDGFDFRMLTLGYVPAKDNRVYAAVIAAYLVFGYAMFLLLKEFQWFTKYRHEFLSRAKPDNYSVFVSGIPPEYRSNESLLAYFREVYGSGVKEANVALNLKYLESHVNQRAKVVAKLEHAINVLNVKGERPMHKVKKSSRCCGGKEKVDSINTYTEELEEHNQKISRSIRTLEEEMDKPVQDKDDIDVNPGDDDKSSSNGNENGEEKKKKSLISSFLFTEDGTPKNAAFVTFSSLKTRASAMQMVQHETPFTMVVQEAPMPKDIFWSNVGMTHKKQQLSNLLGKLLTAVLCIFWAVPVAFVTSLSNVDALKEQVPFLEDWTDAAPWLEGVLAQLAPLLLVVLIALLPIILMTFAKIEGYISTGRLMGVFFMKLCIFNIIHTFLIVTISGTIFKSIKAIADKPAKIVDMLASSIPSQSSFFIQYSLVKSFISLAIEIIRIIPLVKAWIRSKFGPNLTEKERNTPWLGLTPLSVPPPFEHAKVLSFQILFLLILFVYAVMSPIQAFVQGFLFTITGMVYRHQFMYIYEPIDSGGELWAQSVKLIIASMFIAQITLFGVLGLKKDPTAVALIAPLFIITVLFSAYLNQQHYVVTKYLPGLEGIKKDKENASHEVSYEFLDGEYKQPALQAKSLFPENMMEVSAEKENFEDDHA